MAGSGTKGGSAGSSRTPAELAAALRELAAESADEPATIGGSEPQSLPARSRLGTTSLDAPAPLLASAADQVAAAASVRDESADAETDGELAAPDDVGPSAADEVLTPPGGGAAALAMGNVEAPTEPFDDAATTEVLAPLEQDPEVDEPAAFSPASKSSTPWTDLAWQHPGTEIAARRARRVRLGVAGVITAIAVTLAIVAWGAFRTNNPPMGRTVRQAAPISTTATSSSATAKPSHAATTGKAKRHARAAARHHKRQTRRARRRAAARRRQAARARARAHRQAHRKAKRG